MILHIILTNKVSLESQEDVDSIDINISPITYYWAAETAIEPMYHIWYIGRERVKGLSLMGMNNANEWPLNGM